jgi:hypothetical protein
MYQNKAEDAVITPAHLLLVPSDVHNSLNFLNFSNVGVNTLSESSAFPKIRNASKVYNSHLVHTPSPLSSKYKTLSSLYANENTYLRSSSFGLQRQHNLASTSALGNSFSASVLDSNSFEKFLSNNLNKDFSVDSQVSTPKVSPISFNRDSISSTDADTARLSLLTESSASVTPAKGKLALFPSILTHVNDNSDKSGLDYPIFKILSPSLTSASFLNSDSMYSQRSSSSQTSATGSYPALTSLNSATSSKYFNLNGPNSKVLLGDQSIRNVPVLNPSKGNLNLSSGLNTLTSNIAGASRSNSPMTPLMSASETQTGYSDVSLVNKLGSARSFLASSYPAVLSSSAKYSNSLEYDSSEISSTSFNTREGALVKAHTSSKKALSGDVFIGSREKTPRAINTAY